MSDRLILINYFDSLVDEIDLKAEKLLSRYTFPNEGHVHEDDLRLEAYINKRRNSFIEEIENLKKHNLNVLNRARNDLTDNRTETDNTIFDKYCFILDKYAIQVESTFSAENDKFYKTVDETFGYLMVLEDGRPSERNLELFKELVFHDFYLHDNSEEDIEQQTSNKLYQRKIESLESNIFNAKFNNVLQRLNIKLAVFNQKTDEFIIRTTQRELFTVESLTFAFMDSLYWIKQEAIELFFDGPVSITFNDSEDFSHRIEAHKLVESLKWFETNINVSDISLYLKNYNEILLKDFKNSENLSKVSIQNYSMSCINTAVIDGDVKNLKYLKLGARSTVSRGSYDIKANIFAGLRNLEELVVSHNHLDTIDLDAFNELFNLKKLDLSDNELKLIDKFHFKHLSSLAVLNLSRNYFDTIDHAAFSSLQNLKTLSISELDINSIDDTVFCSLNVLQTLKVSFRVAEGTKSTIKFRIFYPLKNLTDLTLSINSNILFGHRLCLHSIDDRLFAKSINLKRLHISDLECFKFDSIRSLVNLEEFKLTNVRENLFKSDLGVLTKLTKVKIVGCKIKCLEARTFKGLSNLEELKIADNYFLTIIEPGVFDSLHKLTRLTLVKNNFEDIQPGTFDDLHELNELDLSDNKLTSIGSNLFDKLVCLRRLNLNNNKLTRIAAGTFSRLANLQTLSLAYNRINNMDESVFNGLCNLRKLLLLQNEISTLGTNTFSGVINLRQLDINSNKLTTVDENAFADLNNLIELDLRFNSIESIRFNGLKRLRTLKLRQNHLNRIASKTFEHMTNLVDLDLDCYKLAEIDAHAFVGLANLERLSIMSTQLTSVVENAFAGLNKLIELYLGYNQIGSLHERAFDSLSNLRILSLTKNNISKIPDNLFFRLSALKRLDLSSNKLNTLEASVFKNLSNLSELDLKENNINQIKAGTFDSLVNLTSMNLYSCGIKNIEENSFEKLNKLKGVSLGNNGLPQSIIDAISKKLKSF